VAGEWRTRRLMEAAVWLTALPGLGLAAEEEGVGSCDGIQRLAGLAVLVRVWGAVVLSNTATD
jgi:hypothetical protein